MSPCQSQGKRLSAVHSPGNRSKAPRDATAVDSLAVTLALRTISLLPLEPDGFLLRILRTPGMVYQVSGSSRR